MTNLILIGQDPGNHVLAERHVPLFPFPRGCAGDRARVLMGLSDREYLAQTDRINLMDSESEWKIGRPELRAVALMRGGLLRDRAVVLFGKRVLEAFARAHVHVRGELREPFDILVLRSKPVPLASVLAPPAIVGYCPHPSGRNYQWNDPALARRAREFFDKMRRLAEGGDLPEQEKRDD